VGPGAFEAHKASNLTEEKLEGRLGGEKHLKKGAGGECRKDASNEKWRDPERVVVFGTG